jgi:hypothetical protein
MSMPAGITPRVIRHMFAITDSLNKKAKPGEKVEVGGVKAADPLRCQQVVSNVTHTVWMHTWEAHHHTNHAALSYLDSALCDVWCPCDV